MSLYTMGDLHLSISVPQKTMELFGGWEDYINRIQKNWNDIVKDDDVVVIPGDISWAMRLKDSVEDFSFIESLKGTKVIMRGNHDYWWGTKASMIRFFEEQSFKTLHILSNDHFNYNEEYAVCGTRGWVYMNGEENDAKIQAREAARLEMSINSALKDNRKPIVFLHYPPLYAGNENKNILDVLEKYDIKQCFYGHIHGKQGHKCAFQGEYNGTVYRMVSSDYLQFFPYKVM